MGGPGSVAAWAAESEPRGGRDRVHLTRIGYTQLATKLSSDLLRAYDLWKADGAAARKTWGVALR
jgi:hypothetical protein